jgi:hypothetical protein
MSARAPTTEVILQAFTKPVIKITGCPRHLSSFQQGWKTSIALIVIALCSLRSFTMRTFYFISYIRRDDHHDVDAYVRPPPPPPSAAQISFDKLELFVSAFPGNPNSSEYVNGFMEL